MHPSQSQTDPTDRCPTRPGLIALVDPLLLNRRPAGLLVVGVVLRRGRLHLVVRPSETPPPGLFHHPAPRCWRAVGLVVDVTTRRHDGDRPRSGRLVHLVDRYGATITRLASDGRPPRTATEGHGPLDDLCRRLLGISPATGTGRP